MNRFLPLFLACLTLMIAIVEPASAQDSKSPAAFVPLEARFYAEIQVSEEAELQQMVRTLSNLSGSVNSSAQFALVSLDSMTSLLLPGVSYDEDVAPWLGDTIGAAYFDEQPIGSRTGTLFIFPAADEAALAEHRDALIQDLDEGEGEGDIKFYEVPTELKMAILDDAVLIGTEDELRAALAVRNGEPALSETDLYARLWGQLPPDAALKFGMRTEFLRESSVSNADMFAWLIDMVLRFNPSVSETETALTNADWYGGLGGALDLNENRFEFTAVVLANAENPAPQLSTETAGAALLDYVPDDAVLVFDSYDMSLASIIGGLAIVGPAVGEQFNFIVMNLSEPPDPDKDPPQPPPLPSVDDTYASLEPQLAQLEMIVGMDAGEVFETLSGEYAVAILPKEGDSITAGDMNAITGAVWLQTDDTAGVIDLLDTGAGYFMDFSRTGMAIEREVETLSNAGAIITWRGSGSTEIASYGTLSDDVAFFALPEGSTLVTDAALGGDILPQSEKFPRDMLESYGMGNEALLYIDMENFGGPLVFPNAPDAMDSLAAAFDVREDGVFVLRMTLSFTEE